MPQIVDRIGCDLNPIDIGTTEGRALLGSYVWVDDVERFRRLGDAMAVAAKVPATVVRMDAADFAAGIDLADGTTTVVWHSAMWVYLSAQTQQRIQDAIAEAGRQGGAGAIAWCTCPGRGSVREGVDEFALVTRTWDGSSTDGRPVVLATGMSHGHPVRLVTPAG